MGAVRGDRLGQPMLEVWRNRGKTVINTYGRNHIDNRVYEDKV